MSEPFIGQIITTGFGFAPKGYALCNGQILPVQQNQALFALLGVMYGGDGVTKFALPDLRGRAAVGMAPSMDPAWQPTVTNQGGLFGSETITLTAQQIPAHIHMVSASSASGGDGSPSTSETFAQSTPASYGPATGLVPLAAGPTSQSGGNAPHLNMQPSLTVSMSIALMGLWPSRN
jgi:microcystin-dependent protein